MRNLALAAALLTLTACAVDEKTEPDDLDRTSRDLIDERMDGDEWWGEMDADQRNRLYEQVSGVCPAADEHIDYVEGSDRMRYTWERDFLYTLYMSGEATRDIPDDVDVPGSVSTFVEHWVDVECPEHSWGGGGILRDRAELVYSPEGELMFD